MKQTAPHALVIEARFYGDLADALFEGVRRVFDARGVTYERIAVPGVLEIPAALSMALTASDDGRAEFDLVVLNGCVIRGETGHYDIVAGESNRAIMDLVVETGVPLGNAILTVENGEQAWDRADPERRNKGGHAAEAALAMYELAARFAG
ncbi:6,7-dimethyl-8-ribityllumazine synthase [Amorphus orientalis]|uniref:6,7-dimethyl-8-ribityllumazine synthase n=1 Tax=Amorphus orientalis TaxID=649198 RepID=A0AAE4ASA7_9HYPH|nr:6,7-dimethyl-8-ribityllumazine synthase [Amorphus orientalis]MDQ0316046.1 6,7-dimethyl-8-ribityllumazine synthase [Amorphus orientalis]